MLTSFLALVTVVLPAITIAVELFTGMCADTFFDPLPTVGHVLVVAVVPVINALTLRALGRRRTERIETLIFAQAFVVAVSATYAVLFAPLVPLAVVAVAMFGLGLLALAPLLSLVGNLLVLERLRRLRATVGRPARRTIAGGLCAGLGALLLLQLPVALTRIMMAAAASDDPSTRTSGLTWLRRLGQRDLMLRACQQRPRDATDLLGTLLNVAVPVSPQKMQEIYYRVTDRPFDSDVPPRTTRVRLPWSNANQWDGVQGGTEVGVVALPGLSLDSSRIDGSVDGRAALAYLEWTFAFRNDAPVNREARAEIALPPGGVVSRVTLWVNGQEREASFAGRDITRQAYENVVRARRDPILVTTTAPDRVLVQAFPVPGDGGVMKARIGITAPLQLTGRDRGVLVMPFFTQRNFAVPARVGHAIWFASKDPLLAPAAPLALQPPTISGHELRGVLAEPARPGPIASIAVQWPVSTRGAWTADRTGEAAGLSAAVVAQTLQADPLPVPSRLVVVIDGSASMQASASEIQRALAALPATIPLGITVAGDQPHDLLGGVQTGDPQKAAARIQDAPFAGGADSLAALIAAWELAAAVPGGAVLWIAGAQPVRLGLPEELQQRLERRRDGPRVYTYAALGGQNHLLASIGSAPGVVAVPRYTADLADLQLFVRQLGGGQERLVPVRTREAIGTGPIGGEPGSWQTSDHLARLWARDRIDALLRGDPGRPPTPSSQQEGLALASRYRLVTAVSGAVVLETDRQTVAAGLEPGGAATVPTVPEPETWALLLSLAATFLWVAARRRWPGAMPRAV